MNWIVFLTDTANKELRRLPPKDRVRIDAGIKEMEENPFKGDIIKLGGEHNRWRRRIGAYRIMYNLVPEKRDIFIYDIKRRTSSTY